MAIHSYAGRFVGSLIGRTHFNLFNDRRTHPNQTSKQKGHRKERSTDNHWTKYMHWLPSEYQLGEDINGDGLLSGHTSYVAISKDGQHVELQTWQGKKFSNKTSTLWDITGAKETYNGFTSLVEGWTKKGGKQYQEWEFDKSGVLQAKIGVDNKPGYWGFGISKAVNQGWEYDYGKDLDNDGLIEGGIYKLAKGYAKPITLKTANGQKLSSLTSSNWDAIAAHKTDSGFKILMAGEGDYENQYEVWSANQQGLLTSEKTGWTTIEEAIGLGWEFDFAKDINNDGLIKGGSWYQLSTSEGAKDITFQNGDKLNDFILGTTKKALAATKVNGNYHHILIKNNPTSDLSKELYGYMVTDKNGEIKIQVKSYLEAADAIESGWELKFNKDMDKDGILQGNTSIKLASNYGSVELSGPGSSFYSSKIHGMHKAIKAVQNEEGFSVLYQGKKNSFAGKYGAIQANQNGGITEISQWLTSEEAIKHGWEAKFQKDINDDGIIGSRIIDASGDGSVKKVFDGGALEISYSAAKLSDLKNNLNVYGGKVSAVVQATNVVSNEVINLGTHDLDLNDTSKESIYVNIKDKLTTPGQQASDWSINVEIKHEKWNGSSAQTLESINEVVTVQPTSFIGGTVTADSFTHNGNNGQGKIYQGFGGTDVISFGNIKTSDIISLNGVKVSGNAPLSQDSSELGTQALYQGTAFDVLRLKNGEDIYLQGVEKLKFSDQGADDFINLHAPTISNSQSQWNLQAMDVHGAWRFNKGDGRVVLVSLDTGIGDIENNIDDVSEEISDVLNLSAKNQHKDNGDRDHGHYSLSIMGGNHNGQKMAGIAPDTALRAYDVLTGNQIYNAIQDAKSRRQDSISSNMSAGFSSEESEIKLVFQHGTEWGKKLTIEEAWDISEECVKECLSETNDYAFFASAAGNGDENNVAYTDGVASHFADLENTFGNIATVGALWSGGVSEQNGFTNSNTQNPQIASYSNQGNDLTLVAPTDVMAVNGDGVVGNFNGTSAANPNLAGVAALVWSENFDLSGTNVRDIITHSAMDLGTAGKDTVFGHGLVNAESAVRRAYALSENYELASLYSNNEFLV